MNRSDFFSRKLPTSTVTLDDETTLTIRKLTQAEVETCRRQYGSPDKALEGSRYVVSRGVLDETGARVFTDDDMRKLAEADFETVERIGQAILKFSGLIKDDPSKNR